MANRESETHGGVLVLELTGSAKDDLLYRSHRVLAALGVQIVETRVRLVGDHTTQTLQLTESDEGGLGPRRVSEVLAALRGTGSALQVVGRDVAPA